MPWQMPQCNRFCFKSFHTFLEVVPTVLFQYKVRHRIVTLEFYHSTFREGCVYIGCCDHVFSWYRRILLLRPQTANINVHKPLILIQSCVTANLCKTLIGVNCDQNKTKSIADHDGTVAAQYCCHSSSNCDLREPEAAIVIISRKYIWWMDHLGQFRQRRQQQPTVSVTS